LGLSDPNQGQGLLPGRAFMVSGQLRTDASDEMKQVHVFVLVEQTAQDGHHPQTSDKAIASGYHLEQGIAKSLTGWWANMQVQEGPAFVPGPATGTALTVECSLDPPGFQTYVWTERITLTP